MNSKLTQWLTYTPYKDFKLTIASADASFRKYYRLSRGTSSYLVMDSSLEKGSIKPFIEVTAKLLEVDVDAPKILLKNLEDGFLILEDFGHTHYLDLLNTTNFQTLYRDAIDTIVKMQNASTTTLPIYDKEFLHIEMDLMQEWYIEKKLRVSLSLQQKELLKNSLENISEVLLYQPQGVFVHRDFHSRNIMVKHDGSIGVIDYQDAMSGAITYDLVSLLKDCYIAFERSSIEKLALEFRDKKKLKVDNATFLKWFDFMGLQRHIKVLGIFSRLHIRDNKEGYLKDIPLTLKYVLETAKRYEETQALAKLLKEIQ